MSVSKGMVVFMEESRTNSKNSTVNYLVWGVVVLVIYVLSIGPAAYLLNASGAGRPVKETVERFYTPLFFLAEKTGTDRQLETYITYWWML